MNEYHTDELIRVFSRHSHDPITQVVCLFYHIRDKELVTWGVNRAVPRSLEKMNEEALQIIRTPLHKAKKLLMKHAEIDALQFLDRHPKLYTYSPNDIGVYCSLQPCIDCIKTMLGNNLIGRIEWKEDNRHQDDQEIIKDIMPKLIPYQSNPEGLTLKYRFPS